MTYRDSCPAAHSARRAFGGSPHPIMQCSQGLWSLADLDWSLYLLCSMGQIIPIMLGKGLESSSVGKALSMDKALVQSPAPTTNSSRSTGTPCYLSTWDPGGSAVLVHPQLLSEFKASLGHMRSSLKNKQQKCNKGKSPSLRDH